VCGADPFCCSNTWDAQCVSKATNDCGACGAPVCGDGQKEFPEQCDDGNTSNNDGCSSTCQKENPVCGNDVVELMEECDDGNASSNDGCSAACQFEGFPCVPHATPGVASESAEVCVCALDPFCCQVAWDAVCVQKAISECNVACGDPCSAHANPGSNQVSITQCVCASDAYCCNTSWDATCVTEAQNECGACGGGVCGNGVVQANEECDDGDTTSGDGCSSVCQYEGSVCVPHPWKGADNDAVVSCTCGADPFCCNNEWDAQCVDTASSQCNAGCGSPCSTHASPGSSDGDVTECVCAVDPVCCQSGWDFICVLEAVLGCGATCP
jgi:cysteine-rich repeat protein